VKFNITNTGTVWVLHRIGQITAGILPGGKLADAIGKKKVRTSSVVMGVFFLML